MKYRVVGPVPVHNIDPGSVVEPDTDWDIPFLLATGHLEPAKNPATKTEDTSDPEQES